MKKQLYPQALSEKVGQQITNVDNKSLLDLDTETIINLFKSKGLILFRGFETNVEIFTEFTNRLSTSFMDYTGGVFNRKIINGDQTILSVNDFNHEIKLHGEMYYQQTIPLMLWFFCAQPAAHDGQTIVCDGRGFFEALSPTLKALFNQKRLQYKGYLTKEQWQQRYKANDIKQLKEICESANIQVKVNEDESVNLHYTCPAIHLSQWGEYQVFINSLLPAKAINSSIVNFEDGSEITEEIMAELNELAENLTVEINWQKGDILMIDNTRIMHGRRAFSDPQRSIYLRLCSPAFS